MTTSPGAPVEVLGAGSEAEGRLLATIAPLDDATMARPSLLAGWTVAHLLTHLARNADSHVRRTTGAIAGVVVDQYAGGLAERAADIEAGSGRSAAAVRDDVGTSSARLLQAWSDVPDDAWAKLTRDASGRERRLDELPARRWLEVEVHLIDLGCGPTHRDWSDAFVSVNLADMRADAVVRLSVGNELPAPGRVDTRDELAWLFGRLERDDLPVLGPWK
jgi:maleylpyruvate isomerase